MVKSQPRETTADAGVVVAMRSYKASLCLLPHQRKLFVQFRY